MPFINLDIHTARDLLEDDGQFVLEKLLRNGIINPHEYDLLISLREFSKKEDHEEKIIAKEKLNELCTTYFPKDAARAMKLLTKFTASRRNVSWVLFSRTIQFIPFKDTNPLEGYKPKLNEIIKTRIFEKLKLK